MSPKRIRQGKGKQQQRQRSEKIRQKKTKKPMIKYLKMRKTPLKRPRTPLNP